jgi:hypothetical protein
MAPIDVGAPMIILPHRFIYVANTTSPVDRQSCAAAIAREELPEILLHV